MPKDTFGRGEAVANSVPLPTPLFGTPATSKPPPISALGPLREPVAAISTLTQAPQAIAMQSVLAAVSLATQGFADVDLLHGRCPVSLFLLTVAESGERKSACDRLATRSIRDVEDARRQRFDRVMKDHLEHQAKRAGREESRVEDAYPFNVERPPAGEPRDPSLCLSDVTIEGIFNQLQVGTPSIAILSDEGGQVFGGYAMKQENKLKSAADLSKFWDGDRISKHRASSRPIILSGRRVSLHLMMQPGVARASLGDATFRDQGLLSRTLLAWPESRIGHRCMLEDAASMEARRKAQQELELFHERIKTLLNFALPVKLESAQELDPGLLLLSDGARRQLVEFYNKIERAQQDGAAFANIRGFASKAVEQAARIAGVLTLYSDPYAAEVAVETMADALTLVRWYLDEALRILDTGYVSPELRDADHLRIWLIETYAGEAIDVRTVNRSGPNRLRNADMIRQLFAKLSEHGWLVPAPPGTMVGDSTPRKAWRIVRP